MKVSNNDIYFVFTQSTSPGWALKSAVCSNGTVTNSLKERFIASGFYNHCKVFWPGIQIKCIKPISLSLFSMTYHAILFVIFFPCNLNIGKPSHSFGQGISKKVLPFWRKTFRFRVDIGRRKGLHPYQESRC